MTCDFVRNIIDFFVHISQKRKPFVILRRAFMFCVINAYAWLKIKYRAVTVDLQSRTEFLAAFGDKSTDLARLSHG